jgi:hypothetical protein
VPIDRHHPRLLGEVWGTIIIYMGESDRAVAIEVNPPVLGIVLFNRIWGIVTIEVVVGLGLNHHRQRDIMDIDYHIIQGDQNT